jgi:hypothetical protein
MSKTPRRLLGALNNYLSKTLLLLPLVKTKFRLGRTKERRIRRLLYVKLLVNRILRSLLWRSLTLTLLGTR